MTEIVHTTLRVYQHVETEDFRAPLNELADELLRDVTKSSSANPCSDGPLKRMEPRPGLEPGTCRLRIGCSTN
jgi:hypothetical protein